ncbi:MAG TPA: M14 family metallopeptidase [Pyrinomonadaceae bacterium]|nr:M14 family metallopeptidase [Pyrinomonadaceae bacterium]
MSRHRSAFIAVAGLLIVLFCAGISTNAQKRVLTSSTLSTPSPRLVLGFTPGDEHTIADWRQITDYFARLDKASDRVLVQTIGETTLKKPIIVALISSRENILARDKYKDIQRRLADPRLVRTEREREQLIATGKVVVTISCSIHSTEIVASQMSMQLAYELATAQDAATREILDNTIIVLIPSANPDGVDIVANWYRKTLGTPFEGKEPPELYHHYAGHDDNRDWFMLNLKETRAITNLLWQQWFPAIVYDVHQQGSNGSRFFVPPFYDPPNPHISPLLLRQVGLLGHKIAADLEAANYRGVLTNAVYDTWWHGGFRTAPYFHNSVGILTEAASARLMSSSTVTKEQLTRSTTRGLRSAVEPATNFPNPWPGGEWRPRDIMNLEMSAARSVLSIAAKYRASYLRNFFELGTRAINEPIEANDPIAYLIPAGQGHDEATAKMVSALVAQGVEVFRLDRELHATYGPQSLQRTNSGSEKLGTYRMLTNHTVGFHEVPAGSYIVFVAQPQRSNVLALFEPQIYPNRLNATGEAERPYDVTGWTLPLQMGVEAPAVMAIQEATTERRLSLIKNENEVRKDLALNLAQEGSSPIVNPVKTGARIGIYKGSMGNMDEGWTRYVFDTFNVPFKSVNDADMRQAALSTMYDVIVFPSQRTRDITEGNAAGSYPAEFTGGISNSGAENLKRFVEDGGTLVCFDAACDFAIKQFKLPLRNVLENVRSTDFYCPGSIVSLSVDTAQPLARGFRSSVDAYFINSSAFETTGSGVRVIAHYEKENLLRSGWLLGEEKLRGQIALAEVAVKKGRVIVFGFRPQHRGQAWGTLPFIWNAMSRADAR